MVDICYVISHGFAARMILHSDVIPSLRAMGLSVAIITPNARETPVRIFADEYDVHLEQMPPLPEERLRFYGQARYYLYENVQLNPSLWAKHLRAVAEGGADHPWRWLRPNLLLWLNRLAVRSSGVRSAFQRVERMLLANQRAADLLRELRPGLLVSTYPVAPDEACLLLEAQRAGVPTVGQLLSWDNISAKGRFTVVPDYFAAWGPIMRAELQSYYEVSPERIIETGVAHFDRHVTSVSRRGIGQAVSALGLRPDRPYLFFGMMSPYFTPYEIDIVEWVARAVETGRFGPKMQLVIRPHPQNVQGYMADTAWLPRLDALASDRVAIDYPILESSSLMWNMNEADLPKLANLLAGCALSLNSGSTLSIDAIIHDKPVILTLFDADHQLPWWQSARRGGDYLHLAKMTRLGGVQVAHSFSELEQAIGSYLGTPGRDADGRQRVRREEVGICDGMASVRVAEALHDFLLRTRSNRQPGTVKSAILAQAEAVDTEVVRLQ